jgi:hypothetical protein
MRLAIITVFGVVAIVHPLSGQPLQQPKPERELAQLSKQHVKALASATDAINQLYRIALRQLLLKVNASDDLSSVPKIEDAIARLQSAAKPKEGKPTTEDDLFKFLAGTVWNISNERPDGEVLYTLTFLKNGTFIHSDGRTGVWRAQSARDIKLWNWDPANLNEDLTQFRAVGTGVIYFGNLKK